jgi:hypothetical protein
VQPRRQAVITRKWSPEAKNVVAEKAANGRRDGLLILLLETWVNRLYDFKRGVAGHAAGLRGRVTAMWVRIRRW